MLNRRHWSPTGDTHTPTFTARTIPQPGHLIAHIPTRKAWRILDVTDANPANWSTQTTAVWEKAGSPSWETWPGRERLLLVEPPHNPQPNGKDRRGLQLSPWWAGEQWRPLTDPYPVCADCGLLWPCFCKDRNDETATAMAELDRLAAVPPGACWACSRPITARQRSVVFDGENLLMPGAGPAAFHASHSQRPDGDLQYRGSCRSQAEDYEERWAAAAGGRTARLRCGGVRFDHDGFAECSAPHCPGGGATHRLAYRCTTQVFPGSASFTPGLPLRDGEIRPPTKCVAVHCRGSSATTQVSEEMPDREDRP